MTNNNTITSQKVKIEHQQPNANGICISIIWLISIYDYGSTK
jgi:hypothetical protein